MRNAVKAIIFLRQLFTREEKIKAIGVAILMLINIILDLLSLALILPVIKLILTENFIENNKILTEIYLALNFSSENDFIIATCFFLLAVFIFKNILSLFISFIQINYIQNTIKNYSLKLLERYFSRGLNYIKNHNSNKLVFNVYAGLQRFGNNVLVGIINLFNESLIVLIIFLSIAIYDIKIVLLLIALVMPLFYLFYNTTKNKITALGYQTQEFSPKLSAQLFQTFHGYEDTVISNTFEQQKARVEVNLDKINSIQKSSYLYKLAPTKLIEISLIASICIIILYGIHYIESKSDLITLLGIFMLAAYRTMPSINRILIAIMSINENIFLLDILKELKSPTPSTTKNSELLHFNQSLELKNISFAFPDQNHKPIFKDFSLKIAKGETVGIIGPSGSGKTTLMNILLGFHQVHSGQYLIDKQDFKNIDKTSFYQKIAYVQQNVYLTDDSIAANVAFGQNEEAIDYSKVKKSLDQAQLSSFYEDQEKGMYAEIGENGVKISGGQRQRIGIARALYYDAEILFFDEATSALDNKTEEEITKAIHSLSQSNLTIIVIAHRLSTLKYVDRIVDLSNIV